MATADYTLINLQAVENVAAQFGSDAHQARFAKDDLGAEQTGVGHHRLEPGARQQIGHRHDVAEEVYVILSGSGRVKLDDEILDLQRLDAIRVSPPVIRSFEAGPEGLEFLACGPRHDGDGEAFAGWWSD
jgi:uncharacterized cupin superfamily protein